MTICSVPDAGDIFPFTSPLTLSSSQTFMVFTLETELDVTGCNLTKVIWGAHFIQPTWNLEILEKLHSLEKMHISRK